MKSPAATATTLALIALLLASTCCRPRRGGAEAFTLLGGGAGGGSSSQLSRRGGFTAPISSSRTSSSLMSSSAPGESEAERAETSSSSSGMTSKEPSTAPRDPALESDELERRLSLLDDAIRSFNSSAAKELIDEFAAMRKGGSGSSGGTDPTVVDSALNDLLSNGPDRPIPFWLRKPRRFLARFSKRARLASLKRTLDLTTPPPASYDDEEVENDDAAETADAGEDKNSLEDQMRRRRRALTSLLRQLASSEVAEEEEEDSRRKGRGVAIAVLERRAAREARAAYRKEEDLTDRRPDGLETPDYEVVVKYPNKFEIRRYEPFSVCSVSMCNPRPADAYRTDATVTDPERSPARAFGALAGYLFGKNKEEEAMAMTTPVLTTGKGEGREMSFVLPSKFWEGSGIDGAPKPLDGSGVKLKKNMGGERAVVMFGGYASKNAVKEREKQLLDELARHDQWEAVDNEQVTLSQYNDPFTPPWKRLNEVSIAVQPRIIEELVNS